MELELGSGSVGARVVSLSVDSPTADLGRGDQGGGGGPSADRTVSRRHVSLRLLDGGGEPGVAFEVVGRNPVVVRPPNSGSSSVFRSGEKGELRAGDALSLSLKAPVFWTVRRREGNGEGEGGGEVEAAVLDAVARREKRTRERKEREREMRAAEEAAAMEVTVEEEGAAGSDAESLEIDLASIDPVREFAFLSMDHEFDSYPKGRIRAPKDWNWFLEETKRNSDDEDDKVSSRRCRSKGWGRNKKKDGEGEDENWTDESEDEKESLARGSSVKRAKYATRSKDPKKPRQENSKAKSGDSNDEDEEVEEEEDEEDETLGGFVVNDEDDEPMEGLSDDGEEEEEFDDEEDDD
ncbi:hypothetical protein HU200_064889 [Digitaria exilis]|uniref:FHA domain-containing protein n=1 Tax=Digitaria exilis TaxID=1010633 RepID=A0A835DVN7_9POAL|nr:hypothetical protein HU200_064889 [Digitaria exilis]